jgi:AcrR family transcriptional regulator
MGSSIREENAQRVRQRIAEAVAEHLEAHGMDGLTLPAIARRAGISVATIYRYHPTREALLEAYTDWLRAQLRIPSFAITPATLPDSVANAFASFDRIRSAVRAQLALPAARESFRHVRAQRLAALEEGLEPLLSGRSPEEQRQVLAVLAVLTGAPAWALMSDDYGLNGEQAGQAAAWAVRVLLDELRRTR